MTLAPEHLLLSHPHLRPCDLAAVFGFDGLKTIKFGRCNSKRTDILKKQILKDFFSKSLRSYTYSQQSLLRISTHHSIALTHQI